MTTPTLHEDRIDKMRLSVMHSVDQDIKRRGRRARNIIGLTAASVLVVGLGGYVINAVESTSLSSTSSADSGSSGGSLASEPDAAGDSSGSRQEDTASGRQVITTGQVSVTVERPRDVAQKVSAYVESIDGRVDDRTEDGSGDDTSATLTVRVPSTKVTATINRLKTYGTVEDVSLQNDDVTSQAQDLDARIDALGISISRLEKILAEADTSSEVIKAENALTKRQEQLESLRAERKGIADQVSLSTLTIDLSQKASVDSVEPGGFSGGLRDGWNGLVSTVNHVVEVVGVLLPWAVVALLVAGAVSLVSRRLKSWN